MFALTQTLHEQVEFAYALKYAQNAHPSDPWPPKNRLGIIFAGLVDISLLTRNGTADPVIIEGLARSYEGALHQVRLIAPLQQLGLPTSRFRTHALHNEQRLTSI